MCSNTQDQESCGSNIQQTSLNQETSWNQSNWNSQKLQSSAFSHCKCSEVRPSTMMPRLSKCYRARCMLSSSRRQLGDDIYGHLLQGIRLWPQHNQALALIRLCHLLQTHPVCITFSSDSWCYLLHCKSDKVQDDGAAACCSLAKSNPLYDDCQDALSNRLW